MFLFISKLEHKYILEPEVFFVSLLSYEGPMHQNLGHLYRKTHNKKTNINQN